MLEGGGRCTTVETTSRFVLSSQGSGEGDSFEEGEVGVRRHFVSVHCDRPVVHSGGAPMRPKMLGLESTVE